MVHLDNLLDQSTSQKDYSDQVQWLLQISEWLRLPKDLENHKIPRERVYSVRIKYLLQLLGRNPSWSKNFTDTVASLLQKMSSISLFTGVGMTSQSGFLQDFLDRLQEKILPQSPLTDDLSTLLSEVFPNEEESLLVDGIEASVLTDFLALFEKEEVLIESVKQDLLSSAYVLACQILSGSISIQKELFELSENPVQWPESDVLANVLSLQKQKKPAVSEELYRSLSLCEDERKKYYDIIQTRGIKVDLIYHLETQGRRIERLRSILHLLDVEKPTASHVKIFVSQLILDIHHQKSLRSFFVENLGLLTQRIVQRNSDVGEHYVTFNWHEFRKMFQSALGGGGITALTVYIKIGVASLGATGFIKGVLESINYSGSFLGIQIMGWTLATKQPSATAPFLAQSMSRSISESRKAVVALLRTQFIAVLGNLSLVFPICFGISFLALTQAHPILDADHAKTVFFSTDIFGPSPIYAAFTGCLLFTSSLIAGWVDNWVVLHRVPNRIEHHQTLLKWLGREKTAGFAEFLRKNSNALGANISLGMLLGFVPQILKFLNFPLDVRHVTLATGSFAASLPIVIQLGVDKWQILNSVLGILCIGVLNISVSFALALLLASVSSKVRFSMLWSLTKWGLILVLTKPWLLIVPEKDNTNTI